MENDQIYHYVKLVLDYFSVWALILVIFVILIYKNPQIIGQIPKYISKAKFGDFELELREVKEKLAETEAQISELEEENSQLREIYKPFDPHLPVSALAKIDESLKDAAPNIDDITKVYAGLREGADAQDVYAAAVIIRSRRDPRAFDRLVDAIDRIGSHEKLEGLRYHTVWTLASAVHKTVLAAVRNRPVPTLTHAQLDKAKAAIEKLASNPHVQNDRPARPDSGIRGPCRYALDWIERGLSKHENMSRSIDV